MERKHQESETARRVPFWRSLQTKYALTYLVIVAAVVVLLNTYPLKVSQTLAYQSKQTSLQNQASVLASALATGPDALTQEGATRTVSLLLGSLGVTRVVVTDTNGMVLCDFQEGSQRSDTVGQYAMIWEIVTALRGNNVFRSEYAGGALCSRAAVPVTYRSMTQGAVYLYEYDAEQGALLQGIQTNLRTISIVICLVTAAMGVVFSKALTRRIAQLLRGIHTVRQGEYSHRVTVKGGDELSRLADEFNELTGRLQTTEEVRRRFVSDASHELKTPLASIRLLTDSILQADHMDGETAREFLTDIGDEAERLTRITEKLLTLTRLDTAHEIHRAPVDVKTVVERVEHMLSPLARAANVSLEMSLQPGCVILATEDDLYQVAFNLMENAVKYNLPGGTVTVTLKRTAEQVILLVEDTGVGIPEDDLPKIFDRFYRVDKARSRAAGGTGLGLSIVRDTVRQHNGSVDARRREQGGTCFTVTFPLWTEEGGTDHE
ncbi:two-component sensor histidine kinase [Flavonifractor sp. An82]|uniref:sensor histidine kinase n=1 Tax=Flavonifractor sp. An82 TaxID=1965660 RepID=UPI000B3AD242|nr:HAMP domain-containing sensor histidine kinase [Flavonifractor sp. An82]OUN21978.1 two-component sensor histidine kinase [Flavonifractor sp. An82]